jgi:protein-disulfide isomerase
MVDSKSKKVRIEFEPSTLWKAGTIIFAVLFVISLLTGGFKGSGSAGEIQQIQVPSAAAPGEPQPTPVIKAEVNIKGEPCTGDKDADILIVEFTDYQCPFCERAYSQTYPEIKKLVDSGDVRFCVKDYPLPFHTEADEASIAANCAAEQDANKYWDMHDKLFETQGSWSGNADATSVFTGYAKELGLDESKFTTCMGNAAKRKEVDDDIAEGSAVGVTGTPSFTINDKLLVGAQPWAAFKTVIDAEKSK